MSLLFASQTAPGGPTVILPALLIAGLLVALRTLLIPFGNKGLGQSNQEACNQQSGEDHCGAAGSSLRSEQQ